MPSGADRGIAALDAEAARRRERLGSTPIMRLVDSAATLAAGGITDPDDTSLWPEPLDLEALGEREPEPPRHIINPWLPAGEVALLAGHGGAGKSLLALHLGACVALGRSWCGVETARRRVVYISAEDPRDVLHWRLARICAHLGVGLEALDESLLLLDCSRTDAELMAEAGHGEEPILTARYEALRALLRPDDVLILDGASDVYGASEIVRRHVRRFVRSLRQLIGPDGAALLLAHVDKAAARDGSAGDRYSGSTAWHNSVRSRWTLATDPEGDALMLSLSKANYAKAGAEIRLRWNEQAHLYLPEAVSSEGGIVAAIRERQERDGIIAAMRACASTGIVVPAALQGPRTAFNVLAARPELPDSLRHGPAAKRRFRIRLEELRQIPVFEEREIRRGNRHTTLALVLVDRGSASNAPNSNE